MTYRITQFPMTLSDSQGHAPVASLLKCNSSYSCAAADKTLADMARRAVSLQ